MRTGNGGGGAFGHVGGGGHQQASGKDKHQHPTGEGQPRKARDGAAAHLAVAMRPVAYALFDVDLAGEGSGAFIPSPPPDQRRKPVQSG